MLRFGTLALLLTTFATLSVSVNANDGDRIIGLWLTPDDKATIEITRSGDSYAGKIIELLEPLYPKDADPAIAGTPKRDQNNLDEALRSRPIIGLNMVRGFAYVGDGRWENGRIYDPRDGKEYESEMTLHPDGTLEVRGFIGFSFMGKSQMWRPRR